MNMPFFFEAAILSRMRSPVTSRSNWANESRTLSVNRPIDHVVLELLCHGDKRHALGVEDFDNLGKVCQGPRQAIGPL